MRHPQRGDHIKVHRGTYEHHGIFLGNGKVIHFSGEIASKSNAEVRYDSVETFKNGGDIEVVEHEDHDPEQTIRRANELIGSKDYSVFFNNCEHFSNYCVEGEKRSPQVQRGVTSVASGATVGTTGAATTAILGTTAAAVILGPVAAAGAAMAGVALVYNLFSKKK
ncbi:MAG: lecithin retinol acyltransferase family protein [Candidatus Riflebacteria bacterium]|nr:lecithin retinol acyltransferase family protein [Candidatus Riflebacteria bacterium]